MIAYRQAREKLIERVATFTTDSPIGPLQGYAYRSPFDEIAHAAFVYNGIGDGKNVLTRLHKPNIVKDIFTGPARMQIVLNHFQKAGRGVLVYLRDGAAGVPVQPVGEEKSAEADRNRQWREVGVGAQILRDLGITSIVNLTSSVHDYKGLSGFGIEIVSNEKLGRLRSRHSGAHRRCELWGAARALRISRFPGCNCTPEVCAFAHPGMTPGKICASADSTLFWRPTISMRTVMRKGFS